jgi:hypothetical protein
MKINIGKYPKSDKTRKVNIKIDRYDTYSMDHTLALIILPLLIQLKENKSGVPGSIVSDVGGEDYSDQLCFDFYSETHQESFDIACNNWDTILDKMIWSFQQIALEDYDKLYHHGKPEYDWVKTDSTYYNPVTGKTEKTYQMVDKNPNEHWYDFIGHALHEDLIQEGLDLFGKYYRNLWD